MNVRDSQSGLCIYRALARPVTPRNVIIAMYADAEHRYIR